MSEQPRELTLLTACYREAKAQRDKDTATLNPFTGENLDRPWFTFDRFYRGFHWDLLRGMASWASRPVKNGIFNGVENYTTMLTDNSPSFTVMPREESDREVADVVRAAIEYWWQRVYGQKKLARAIKASRIFGLGWLNLYHDDECGECLRVVHPESVLVDADATDDGDFDPTYLIFTYRAQVGELKARFPHEDSLWDGFNAGWRVGMDTERTQADRYENNRNPATSCTVYEFWTKDPERIEWNDEKDIPGKVVTKSRPKYPGGRVLTIAGGVVLEDKPNPYRHREFPFTPMFAYPAVGRFYPAGDVQNVINPVVMRNRMSQLLFDGTVKAGGGYVLIGASSGIDPKKVTNAPIQYLPCRDPSAFSVVRPPAPSRHIFDYMAVLDADTQDTLGLHDISQGKRTAGNPVTAQEVMVLAESDRTRVRSAAREAQWALERLGRQVLSNLAQYQGFKWMLRIAKPQIVPDDASETGETREPDMLVEFTGKTLLRKGEDGEPVRKQDAEGKLTDQVIDFDLKVVDTSTLPATQQEQNLQVQGWLAMGLVTPEQVLKYGLVDIPHREEMLADMKEAAAAPPPMPPDDPDLMPDEGGPTLGMAGIPPEAPPDAAMMGEQMAPAPMMSPEEAMGVLQMMAEQQGRPVEDLMAELAGGMPGAV